MTSFKNDRCLKINGDKGKFIFFFINQGFFSTQSSSALQKLEVIFLKLSICYHLRKVLSIKSFISLYSCEQIKSEIIFLSKIKSVVESILNKIFENNPSSAVFWKNKSEKRKICRAQDLDGPHPIPKRI